jgi:asparagine synthase (glutamine-hydrolysing)
MCGICGQFNLNGHAVDRPVIERMTASIRHRGPDSDGVFVRGPAGLGHRRLSIIDLSQAGNQPMASLDGTKWIVFNGEIYNYAELKRAMEREGERFVSSSDTEVLLRLYEKFGVACLEKVNGMFAFAVWDDSAEILVLARDRIGIKPLYYYLDDRVLVFASEIKALLQCPLVPRQVSPEGFATYFTFGHSFAPETIYRGIKKLLPGHILVCNSAGGRTTKYWDLKDTPDQRPISADEAAAEVRRLLTEAVHSHMVSDVPVGAFLSGGIDSSAIVAFMSQVSQYPVKTFAVGFDVGGYYSELDDARTVAKRFGTEHHEKIVTDLDVENLIDRLVYHYDEPFADAANLPTFIVSEFAREHVKVVLTGEGGDELFGGYRRYYAHLAAPYFRLLPSFLGDGVLKKLIPARRMRRVCKFIDTASVPDEDKRYGTWLSLFSGDAKAELFSGIQDLPDHFDGYESYRSYYNRFPRWDTVNRMLYTDLKGWLPDTYLEKTDKASMAVSLEGRVPFLDHRLVEYAFSLPGRLKVRRRTTKYILKKALNGVLPSSVLYKSKHGFAVPLDDWFRGRLRTFFGDICLGSNGAGGHLLDKRLVERMFWQHINGERDFGIHLWTMLNYQLWYNRFLRGLCAEAGGTLTGGSSVQVGVE